jgi:putative membrane-bound dehydrogenase-like protein
MSRCVFVVVMLSAACVLGHDKPSADFPKPTDTEPSNEPLLAPEEAAKRWQLPPGFKVTLFAAEPHVQQPIAMAFDSRGRLWVAENYTYAQREVNFDMTLRDRIVILEDVDNDGKFDKRTVFWDQAQKLTSIELGFGGVWALCAPHLLFIPDRNRDDVPDGPPEIILDGWDDNAVRHNIVNGLRWGPDGWLYGRHGILATSRPGTPGTPLDQRAPINCGMWRYHPTRKIVDIVCHGTTNPWGHDWDIHGELFMINTVIGHLWHVIPGAHYERMYGEDLNPYVYELIPQTADHFHWDTAETWSDIRKLGVTPTTDQAGGGHAHSGLMIYNGDNWPAEYRGNVFTINLHGRRINRDVLELGGTLPPLAPAGGEGLGVRGNSSSPLSPLGRGAGGEGPAAQPNARRAGFVARHRPDFAKTTDPWFRGLDLLPGPDGGVYIADWSDIGECHENDGVHRSSGRIFKILYSRIGEKTRVPDVSRMDIGNSHGLAVWAKNDWLARQALKRAQELISESRSEANAKELEAKREVVAGLSGEQFDQLTYVEESRGDIVQFRNLCIASHLPKGHREQLYRLILNCFPSESAHVQAWTVRLAADDFSSEKAIRDRFLEWASSNRSGLVLLHLASALQRLPHDDRWPIAEALAGRGEFAGDPVLPLMVWYGIEPAVPVQPEKALALAESSKMPKVRQFIARRLTTEIDRQPEAVAGLVRLLAKNANGDFRLDILRGMSDALRGWRKAKPPAGWAELASKLKQTSEVSKTSEVSALALELSVVFGDGRALDEIRQLVKSNAATPDARRQAIRALVQVRADGLAPLLQGLLGDRELGPDAIRGLAAVSDADTPRLLLDNYKRLQPTARAEAIVTLVSRPAYAQKLLDAVAAGTVDRMHVSPFQLRQMQSFGDDAVSKRIAAQWPELREISAEKARRIAGYKSQLAPDRLATANLPAGRKLFEKSCASCHVLFGAGGKAGPDLTGGQRSNLDYLLENIVDPSATVSANFKMSIVVLTDGRVLNGVVTEKTAKTITLQTPTDRLVLPLGDIEEQRESNLSLMPEGQLDVLKPDEVRDLIGYLMSPVQVDSGQ